MARALEDVDIGAAISGFTINNLRFADDTTGIAETQQDLQLIIDRIDKESKRMGMKINAEKLKRSSYPKGKTG